MTSQGPSVQSTSSAPGAIRIQAAPHEPIRWLWVGIGTVIMGAVAIGMLIGLRRVDIVSLVGGNPEVAFWLLQLAGGVGYLIGGLVLALLSPGKTIREPIIAAVLVFAAQTLYLRTVGAINLDFQPFLVAAVIAGGGARVGAWVGEAISGGFHGGTS